MKSLVGEGKVSEKFTSLLEDASFRAQIYGLAGNQSFLAELYPAIAEGDILGQLKTLAADKNVLSGLFSIAGDSELPSKLGADFDFSSDFDFGGKLSEILQGDGIVKLITAVSGDSELGANFLSVLGDFDLSGKLGGLLRTDGGFAAGLSSLLADGDFVSKIGSTFGLDSATITNLGGLFASDANFGGRLEALFGSSFSGIGKLVGGGDFGDVLSGSFGTASFNTLITDLFAGGEIFSKITALLKDGSFVTPLTNSLSGFCSGELDLQAIVAKLKGNTTFLTQISGLFNASGQGLQKFLGILGKAKTSFFDDFAGFFH